MRTNNFLIMLRGRRSNNSIQMTQVALRIVETTLFFLLLNVVHRKQDCWYNHSEEILRTPSKSLCLAPGSKQGKRLQQCWKKAKFNEKWVRTCLSQKKGQTEREANEAVIQ
ncbi:chemokine (C-X-C motif) ligand 18a, duplicate 1 [Electrophorus electricus]|uniref:chemokine (C-X-C motif) ligand 18a, duplicate 1 n=1 Tax=Electrophorus electricus TaxID=8005 RepID=UPI0015CF86AC|nr:chemokine (C-X-C motif) ligand 18a, duplicate 1 [Electrophorus electricus]